MSHYHERKEKVCLNCAAALYGRYCHVCGQENVEPKETFWGLITHFFYDVTHFDGNFFSTVKYLVAKPGFLSKEYITGRRARYLHPVRMYVFTSAVFFILFFSMFHLNHVDIRRKTEDIKTAIATSKEKEKQSALAGARNRKDSLEVERLFKTVAVADSLEKKRKGRSFINFKQTDFRTRQAYDSAQKALPAEKRDGWIDRTLTYKTIEINENLQSDPGGFFSNWLTKFLHSFPQLLFVSLPIFALLLKLIYVRRKTFYYGDHAIFSIHLYIFTFIALLLFFVFMKLKEILNWDWLNFFSIAIVLYMLYYTYGAMRNFYQQGRLKTFVKYCLLNFMSFFVILILFFVFFMLSIFQL